MIGGGGQSQKVDIGGTESGGRILFWGNGTMSNGSGFTSCIFCYCHCNSLIIWRIQNVLFWWWRRRGYFWGVSITWPTSFWHTDIWEEFFVNIMIICTKYLSHSQLVHSYICLCMKSSMLVILYRWLAVLMIKFRYDINTCIMEKVCQVCQKKWVMLWKHPVFCYDFVKFGNRAISCNTCGWPEHHNEVTMIPQGHDLCPHSC